jgi:hypothetical protein
MLNLDTHILLHALSGRLHEHEISALQADGVGACQPSFCGKSKSFTREAVSLRVSAIVL